MTTMLIIAFPALVILSTVLLLKLNLLLSYLLILILGGVSPFIVDFVYCSILNNECKPDALQAVGFFFLAIYVIFTCAIIYAIIPVKYKRNKYRS